MSSASRGLAPREGLGCFVGEDGSYGLLAQPRRRPQAGKFGYPRSQNTDRTGSEKTKMEMSERGSAPPLIYS